MPAQFTTIYPTEGVDCFLEETLHVDCVRHIGLNCDGLSADGDLNFGHDFFSLGGIACIIHSDCEPVACQPCRYSTSDPREAPVTIALFFSFDVCVISRSPGVRGDDKAYPTQKFRLNTIGDCVDYLTTILSRVNMPGKFVCQMACRQL